MNVEPNQKLAAGVLKMKEISEAKAASRNMAYLIVRACVG
jgi:hypothetical protein